MNEDQNVNVNEELETQEQETPMFTDEQMALINKMIQSESDKRVTQMQKKYQKEIDKQKSLAGLDAEARAKAEMEQKIADYEEQLNQYKLANTKAEIAKVLSNRGLDANLVDFVVNSSDTDECLERIDTLDKIIKNIIKKDRESNLRGSNPKSTIGLDGGITLEQFDNMSIKEQMELKKNNPELFKQLMNM